MCSKLPGSRSISGNSLPISVYISLSGFVWFCTYVCLCLHFWVQPLKSPHSLTHPAQSSPLHPLRVALDGQPIWFSWSGDQNWVSARRGPLSSSSASDSPSCFSWGDGLDWSGPRVKTKTKVDCLAFPWVCFTDRARQIGINYWLSLSCCRFYFYCQICHRISNKNSP